MGLVIVVSLPLILLSLILGFGCYLFGRAKGRKEAYESTQVFGTPAPPPGAMDFRGSPPPQTHFKSDNSANV